MTRLLRMVQPSQVGQQQSDPVDDQTLLQAQKIVEEVRKQGMPALQSYAQKLDGYQPGTPIILDKAELQTALHSLPALDRSLLERTAERIRIFAQQQRQSLSEFSLQIQGGTAGQSIAPVDRAGCYAPGGRYPLPSSVLMTAVTARAAGVKTVWVASPKPGPITKAAAAIAGADALLAAGGAQAIAALTYGVDGIPACDMIVGPGNRWVTAAKQLVSGKVGIDMLAGPSELVVVADQSSDAELVAADLLAQAEHDPDAIPTLVALDTQTIENVEAALARQLKDLPTAQTARAALQNGQAVLCADLPEAIAVCDNIAPEHLQVLCASADQVAAQCNHYGALFIGAKSAEVLGDYGAGPNHVLPTGNTARFSGGLSVHSFLRIRTWMQLTTGDATGSLAADAAALARLEGLEAHARAADLRL